MVKFVVWLILLQPLYSVPLTLPIGLPELPDEHLGERRSLMLRPKAPETPLPLKRDAWGRRTLKAF